MFGGKKCRVLFVEDDGVISMLIEDMLLDLGVEAVGPATTLAEALFLAQRAEIEAAVLDVDVRGSLTYPVADVLRERGIPFVFSTGHNSSVIPERFQDTLTLHKPFKQACFEEALKAALAESPCDISPT